MADVEKMIAIGIVWGATNALMRRGAILWDQKLHQSSPNNSDHQHHSFLRHRLLVPLKNWLNLILIWQYSLPFFLNVSASATFFAILNDSPISLAVPVTNATTFAATAVFAILLGEETHLGFAVLGVPIKGPQNANPCKTMQEIRTRRAKDSTRMVHKSGSGERATGNSRLGPKMYSFEAFLVVSFFSVIW